MCEEDLAGRGTQRQAAFFSRTSVAENSISYAKLAFLSEQPAQKEVLGSGDESSLQGVMKGLEGVLYLRREKSGPPRLDFRGDLWINSFRISPQIAPVPSTGTVRPLSLSHTLKLTRQTNPKLPIVRPLFFQYKCFIWLQNHCSLCIIIFHIGNQTFSSPEFFRKLECHFMIHKAADYQKLFFFHGSGIYV